MERGVKLICLFALLLLISCTDSDSGLGPGSAEREEINKAFARKQMVRIQTVSGDCLVRTGQGDTIHVHLVHAYAPSGSFEAEFEEREDRLVLGETLHGSSSGYSTWTVTVPPETKIEFSSDSGDFEAEGLRHEIKVQTASGNITLADAIGAVKITTAGGDVEGEEISGEIAVSAASGHVEMDDSRGAFQIATASGDIDVSDVLIENESSFSTVSGDVRVVLSSGAEHDLFVASASGKAVLNYNGNAVEGYFEFTARVDRGRIVSPFAFDHEEEFSQAGHMYHRKSFTRTKDTSRATIATASGTAELRER